MLWPRIRLIAKGRTSCARYAIGNILLVVSHRQSNNFGLAELRAVTGIVAVPAVRDLTPVFRERNFGRFRLTQSRAITGFLAVLAV
jgi:hypothetical protein